MPDVRLPEFQMPQFLNAADLAKVKNMLYAQQLQQLQLQEAQDSMQGRNAMAKMLMPGGLDPQGNPAPQTLQGLSPNAQFEAKNQFLKWQKEQADLARTVAMGKKDDEEAAAKADERYEKLLIPGAEKAMAKYAEIMKSSGDQSAAHQAGLKVSSEFLDELEQRGGVPKSYLDRVRAQGFNPQGFRSFLARHSTKTGPAAEVEQADIDLEEGRLTQEQHDAIINKVTGGKAESAEGKIFEDYQKGLFGPIGSKEAMERRDKALAKKDTIRINLGNAALPSAMTGATHEQLVAMPWSDLIKKTKVPLSEDAFKDASMQYALSGKPPIVSGRAANAQSIRNAYEEGRAKVAADFGKTPEEMAAMPTMWKKDAQSLTLAQKQSDALEGVLNSFHNNLESWDRVAKGLPPKFKSDFAKQFKAMDFTGVRSLDDVRLKLKSQFNDETATALGISAFAAAMDYGRISAGGAASVAQTPVEAMKVAEKLISSAADDKARIALKSSLDQDAIGQLKGKKDQIAKITKRMSLSGETSQDDSTSGGKAPPKVDEVIKGHRFKGGDPSKQESWELVAP